MLNTLFCTPNQCCLHLKFVYPDVTYIVLLYWIHLLNSAYSVDLHLAAPDVRLFLQVHSGGESRHGLGAVVMLKGTWMRQSIRSKKKQCFLHLYYTNIHYIYTVLYHPIAMYP